MPNDTLESILAKHSAEGRQHLVFDAETGRVELVRFDELDLDGPVLVLNTRQILSKFDVFIPPGMGDVDCRGLSRITGLILITIYKLRGKSVFKAKLRRVGKRPPTYFFNRDEVLLAIFWAMFDRCYVNYYGKLKVLEYLRGLAAEETAGAGTEEKTERANII